ncbi:MAG: GFA family protein [Parvularculaceae bacterium]|nr:GFA family protein [Parvularculaceae bacterium]
MTAHEGGCHCRQVRFRAAGAPKFVSRCHCESCRRTTGGAFSTWVGFPADAVEWTAGAPVFYASSMGVKRGFCRSCGTPLSYESDRWPGERHFLIGVFDEPKAFTPTSDYMKEEALAWALH